MCGKQLVVKPVFNADRWTLHLAGTSEEVATLEAKPAELAAWSAAPTTPADALSLRVEGSGPYKGAKAQNVITNKRFPDQLLVGINNRNPACFDMYRCDVASGKLTLDTENPGDVLGWGTEDESFEVREAVSRHVGLRARARARARARLTNRPDLTHHEPS